MMRIGRLGFAFGGLLVATAIATGLFRSGSEFAGAFPSSGGLILVILVVIAVAGIAAVVTKYFGDRSSQTTFATNGNADSEEALEALKRRYATGEIDETEFERRLETLFETETVADAKRRVETESNSAGHQTTQESVIDSDERPPNRAEMPPNRPRRRSRRGHCK